jgi:hypothetical protein
LGFGLVIAVGFASSASAATIEVETDVDDFGTGATSGVCTFREAVEAARTNDPFGGCPSGDAAKDTIHLPGSVVLQRVGNSGTNEDGDIDFDGGGNLLIQGTDQPVPDYPNISASVALDDRLLDLSGETVKIEGVELLGGGEVPSGGAIRATDGATLTIAHTNIHDNSANARGGAVSCESGCETLHLESAFRITNNIVETSNSTPALGGGIWTDAPTVIHGQSDGPISFTNSAIQDNAVNALTAGSAGGGIYAAGDLRITDLVMDQNRAEGAAQGGAIAMSSDDDNKLKMKLTQVTLAENLAEGRGGALDVAGTKNVLSVKRSAIVDNTTEPNEAFGIALGGGVYTQARKSTFTESAVDGNEAQATAGASGRAGGIYLTSEKSSKPSRLTLSRTSVTNNSVTQGIQPAGGGIYAVGAFVSVNSTISNNAVVPVAGDGGGVYLQEPTDTSGSARIEFSTFLGNSAGDAGDAIFSALDEKATIRASQIANGADACAALDPPLKSKGYNVQAVNDLDCGLGKPTDASGVATFLTATSPNGSAPVGAPTSFPGSGIIPLTNAFTNNTAPGLDRVPTSKCKVNRKALKVDGRGGPRPAEDGCDSGAIERAKCFTQFLAGPHSFVGRNTDDVIQGSSVDNDNVLAQDGDDIIQTYGQEDRICAGKGDDVIAPQTGDDEIDGGKGRDQLNYNNNMGSGLTVDMAAGTVAASLGNDDFIKVEDFWGSEMDDEIVGDDKANRLTGGGGEDSLSGEGGTDVIDARDGEADTLIDCGPGNNSKEKAKIDEGLDPEPISC